MRLVNVMPFRIRLTIYYAGFFLLTLLFLGIGIFFAVRETLYRNVQRDLQSGTEQMLSLYRSSGAGNLAAIISSDGQVRFQLRGNPARVFSSQTLIVQVFTPRGGVLGRSPGLSGLNIPMHPEAMNLPRENLSQLTVNHSIDGMRLKSQITPLYANQLRNQELVGQQLVGYLQVSRSLGDVEETLQLLVLWLAGGGLAGMLICTGGLTLFSGRVLVPIERITETARSIVKAEDLSRRVPELGPQDELKRLTVTVNDLLARLETLFTTQRRFVADVSHELRTPLTAMQGNLEILARSGYRDQEMLEEAHTDMRRETARLIRMVNDLLVLAQSDARTPLQIDAVELDTLMLEVYRELRPLADGVQLRIGAEDQVIVQGDRDRLKQALLNLGMNAIQHTPPGGSVTIGLEQRDGKACLSVADTGCGINSDDLPHIFERFYRADRSRSRHSGGAGLGLAIVKRIAEAHNGHATVASIPKRGSTFAIWLPINRPTQLGEASPKFKRETTPLRATQELKTENQEV